MTGCCLLNPTIVPGGRVFVWPLIQRAQKLTLNTMTLTIESPKVYTQQGVPISVTGIAQLFFMLSILNFTPSQFSSFVLKYCFQLIVELKYKGRTWKCLDLLVSSF
ncbi:hypothetical protein TNIN_315224 [Trichonephila inaurata madagascariensis]|uniref:Uncharacterized protein n=1 Tax=Trichonephila inaurata madagascariensis TaxID=2747483 RepID=A0A8X7BVC0_9ARAC|nr:hypothetical protein TNIN_489934 [Trichonephila inaurata madagascariensis]GFY63879.1 hypothetical protein TNIN_315224 [Trichonephila inaurata madagascariensis]